MKRVAFFILLVPFLTFLTLTGGCGKKEPEEEPRPKGTSGRSRDKGSTAPAVTREPLKAASFDGIITGRVVLQGEKPVMEEIASIKVHNDKAFCLAGEDFEKRQQTWIIGPDNGVANAVISLKPPAGKYFVIKDEDKKRTDKVTIDQPHCAYIPHVQAVFPSFWDGSKQQPSGQEFIVKNSAPSNHSTKWVSNKNPAGSVNLPSGSQKSITFVPDSVPVQLSCEIHPWMSGRVWVFEHPYYAVTKSDGRFEIKNVPTGVEVGLVAWHEGYEGGFFNGGKDGVKQTFNPGENKLPDLKISAK